MRYLNLKAKCALALAFAAVLAIGPAMAQKGGGKSDRDDRSDRHDSQKGNSQKGDNRGDNRNDNRGDSQRGDAQRGERHDGDARSSRDGGRRNQFEERHRVVVREYYSQQFRSGRCPPGLAKKHNGCMPPGQARKWQMGRPLPRDVIYYSVPQQLVLEFGQPPSGYRYVRVASDILMIAIGTGMIVDAIQDLDR